MSGNQAVRIVLDGDNIQGHLPLRSARLCAACVPEGPRSLLIQKVTAYSFGVDRYWKGQRA